MEKVWSTVRTFGVLLALWVILAIVGLAMGVIPIDGLPRRAATSGDAPDEDALDAGVPEASDGGTDAAPGAVASLDAGEPVGATEDGAPGETAIEPSAAARWTVCPSTAVEPSLSVAQLFGDARFEAVVGCPDGWHVVGWTDAGPARVAVFTAPTTPAGQRARMGPAALGDVDGDGRADLVLPLAREDASGASRGGGLFWIPRDAFGGIREPVALAPIAAVDAIIAPLDRADGADVVAMNRANALAQLPSEAYNLGGGSAPARRAALTAGISGSSVRVADVDRDGNADVVALSRGRVDLFFGDGAGGFPRSHELLLEGVREIAVGDLDGDGGTDLAVLGDGLRWIRAGALDGMEPRGVDGVPSNLRGLALVDVDADGKLDFVGWDHPRLVVLRQGAGVEFELRGALSLAGGPFGPRRHALADLDGDGSADDTVFLGTAGGEDAMLELVVAVDALSAEAAEAGAEAQRELTSAAEAQPIPDAPLVLRATLP